MTFAHHAASHHAVFFVALLCAFGCDVARDGSATGGGSGGVGGLLSDAGRLDGGGVGGSGGFGGLGFGGNPDRCGPCTPPPPSTASNFMKSCCTDEGTCGLTIPSIVGSCLPWNVPATVVPGDCPGADHIFGPRDGCCTLTGWCGLDMTQFGLGCVVRQEFSNGSSPNPITSSGAFIPCSRPLPDAGLDLDGGSDPQCELLLQHRCDPVATCAHDGDQARCQCPVGYADLSPSADTGVTCRDVNECLLSPSPCGDDTCLNTPGSYECVPASAD